MHMQKSAKTADLLEVLLEVEAIRVSKPLRLLLLTFGGEGRNRTDA